MTIWRTKGNIDATATETEAQRPGSPSGNKMRDRWLIAASGPSMLHADLGMLAGLRGWTTLAINCTHRLLPWADHLYAGDESWWERYGDETAGFSGQKWARAPASGRWGEHGVKWHGGRGLCRLPMQINSGGNSGYQAINLAYHLGACRIVLLGFDMHRNNGAHWHGEHEGMLSAPPRHLARWARNFAPLATDLRKCGVRVVNATPGTALRCFPCASLDSAIA